MTCIPLSRASTLGLTPNREPILLKELASATMKSNWPPAIRCAIGAGVARGSAALGAAGAGRGFADDDGVGVAVGLEPNHENAPEALAVNAIRKNVATIA